MTDTNTVQDNDKQTTPPEDTSQQKAPERDLTKEVFDVSSNLQIVIQTKDGTPVTIENMFYALEVGRMLFDINFKKLYITER